MSTGLTAHQLKLKKTSNKFDKWSTQTIDRFTADQMHKKGLKPSPEAPKEMLIRRLYFDLTGLPPSISEIDNFLNNKEKDAYEKVVDRLPIPIFWRIWHLYGWISPATLIQMATKMILNELCGHGVIG